MAFSGKNFEARVAQMPLEVRRPKDAYMGRLADHPQQGHGKPDE